MIRALTQKLCGRNPVTKKNLPLNRVASRCACNFGLIWIIALSPLYFSGAEAIADEPASRLIDVTFQSGGNRIAGLLELPPGAGPLPAIIFVHGDGMGTRRAWRGGYFTLKVFDWKPASVGPTERSKKIC